MIWENIVAIRVALLKGFYFLHAALSNGFYLRHFIAPCMALLVGLSHRDKRDVFIGQLKIIIISINFPPPQIPA